MQCTGPEAPERGPKGHPEALFEERRPGKREGGRFGKRPPSSRLAF
jgi:hypothetical protein